MKRYKLSLGLVFLLFQVVIAHTGVDLRNINVRREVSGKRIENLVSGVEGSTNHVAELDVTAINDVRRVANTNRLDKLTADGLVAPTTVTKAGNPVTVLAGCGGGSSATSSTNATQINGAAAGPVTVVAGSGRNSSSTSTASGATAAAVTVVAGSGSGSKNGTSASAASPAAAVTVVAGGGSNNTTANAAAISSKASNAALNSSTLSPDALVAASTTTAAAAVTVVAGSGSNAAATAANSGCNCACMCPAGSFPISAPQAQPFQLGSMDSSSGTTMQTIASAITVVVGPASPDAQQAVPSSSSCSTVSVNSASLTTATLLAGTAQPPSRLSVTMIASGDPSISASASASSSSSTTSSNTAATPASPAASETTNLATSVPAQSQVAPTSPTSAVVTSAATRDSTTSLSQNQGLPFDISTVALQSRVTVNLGKRVARPTDGVEMKR